MLKAGFVKELIYFTRTKKLPVLSIIILAFAVLDPLLIFGLGKMAESMGAIAENVTVSSGGAEITQVLGTVQAGFVGAMGDLTSTVALISMLMLMQAAGGELKKRATILPNCAGLTPKYYLIPKFVVYPVYMLAATVVGMLLSYVVASIIFGGSVPFSSVLLASLCGGVYAMFLNAVYLCIGLATKKAGLSVAICYGGSTILNMVLSALGAQKFHPFALLPQAQELVYSGQPDLLNIFGSIGVGLLLICALYLVTLMAMTAKRIDNIGEDRGAL